MPKRLFDIAASTALIVFLTPLLTVIAAVVWMTSGRPVVHRATRVGRDQKPFTLYKFRTMVLDAEKNGPGITVHNDARITRVGRILRQTKLDELPQLFNVLQGDMSLVGPRPEDPRYVALYTPEQLRVLSVRPGITSPASVHFRNEQQLLTGDRWEENYVHHVLPAKLRIDLDYVRGATLRRDVQVLWQTLWLFWR